MNGQHLRALSSDTLTKLFGEEWKNAGLLLESDGMFAKVIFLCYKVLSVS